MSLRKLAQIVCLVLVGNVFSSPLLLACQNCLDGHDPASCLDLSVVSDRTLSKKHPLEFSETSDLNEGSQQKKLKKSPESTQVESEKFSQDKEIENLESTAPADEALDSNPYREYFPCIWKKTGEFLDEATLSNLRLVSKKAKNLVDSNMISTLVIPTEIEIKKMYWKQFREKSENSNRRVLDPLDPEKMVSLYMSYLQQLPRKWNFNTLKMNLTNMGMNPFEKPEFLLRISELFPNIKRISISGYIRSRDRLLRERPGTISVFKNLETVNIQCSWDVEELKLFPKLKKLRFVAGSLNQLKDFTQLTTLKIGLHLETVDSWKNFSLMTQLKNLSFLRLSKWKTEEFRENTLNAIAQLPALENLELKNEIYDKDIDIFSQSKTLKKLNLHFSKVSGENLVRLFKSVPTLAELSISNKSDWNKKYNGINEDRNYLIKAYLDFLNHLKAEPEIITHPVRIYFPIEPFSKLLKVRKLESLIKMQKAIHTSNPNISFVNDFDLIWGEEFSVNKNDSNWDEFQPH